MPSFKKTLLILTLILVNVTTSSFAHDEYSDELIIEDGYIWFPGGHRVNSLIITESKSSIVIDQCAKFSNIDSVKIEELDDEIVYDIKLKKTTFESYFLQVAERSQILKGLNKMSEMESIDESGLIDIQINSFIKRKIEENQNSCLLEPSVNSCNADVINKCDKKLKKLPEHYFSNDQTLVLTEAIYPKSIILGSGDNKLKIQTIINTQNVGASGVRESIFPLFSKIQYIGSYKDDPNSGAGSAIVTTRSTKSKRRPRKRVVSWSSL